jgi:YVTN family beta-propeller protein
MTRLALTCVLLLIGAVPGAQGVEPLLLVLNKNDATLWFIDPRSGRTLATVPTGPNSHEVTTTADGRFAVTTNYTGDSLSVIAIAERKEVRRVSLTDLRRPHGITTVGGLVVFTAEGDQAIAAYDPAANRIAWRAPTRQSTTHMVVASRDGATLFTSNIGSNSLTVLERAGNEWRPTHIPVGAGPEGLDLSPDGRELWTAHSGDSRISIVDAASRKVVQTLDLKTKRSNRLKFSRDGRYVFVSDMDSGEVIVVEASARTIVKRLRVGLMPEGILVPPDGDRIYVALTGDNRVVAISSATLEVTQTIATGRGPDGMAWAASTRR